MTGVISPGWGLCLAVPCAPEMLHPRGDHGAVTMGLIQSWLSQSRSQMGFSHQDCLSWDPALYFLSLGKQHFLKF